MPFIDVARAMFAYAPQSTDELAIEENDFLYVLEKGDDDWWKVKKKVDGDDDGPTGLVPQNYLEGIAPISSTRTLYDYTAQTEEELSFSADLTVEIFDKDDPDWFLVRIVGTGHDSEYGFVPSNYLDDGEVESAAKLPSVLPAGRPDSLDERRPMTPPSPEEEPSPEPISPSNAMTAYGRPEQHYTIRNPTMDAKFKTWHVEEIDSRKRRKKGTLGIGNSSIVWSCEADKTWPITSLIEYNTEKKHLFIELSSPPTPASFHFHADSRAIATEISDAIGEIAGATRATGLREVAAASGDPLPPLPETSALAQRHKRDDSDDLPIDDGIKRGVMLYDFDPQGDDELAVRQDQIIEILDDSHEEWWKCKAGNREGVVPASYVDVIKTRPANKLSSLGGPSSAANALAAAVNQSSQSRRRSPVSSSSQPPAQPPRQDLSKPDTSKIRTWTDRSGSFKVEAQYLGLTNGKIQLHKLNGVKISVPLTKMSVEDVQYVERISGRASSPPPPKPPPDSEKPRAKKIEFDWYAFFLECGVEYNVCQRYAVAFERDQMDESILPDINSQTLRTLGVREGDILRIMKRLDEKFGRTAARKKSVRFGGEEVVDEDNGKDDLSDVVKITSPSERRESLFSSGPGGALRNNTTRRGRPTTNKTAPEEVDGTLLSTQGDRDDSAEGERHGVRPLRVPPSRLANFQDEQQKPPAQGFEDDAWTVKPQPAQPARPSPQQTQVQSPAPQAGPPPGSVMHELASISPPSISQSLPPPLQPQTTPGIVQLSPQPTASPMVNRPSSVPPQQTAPQLQPLQPHYTGIPSQQPYSGPTPAQASGTPSLNEQLAKLQIYRQQQFLQPQQTGYIPQFQPQQTGYANGYSSPQQQQQQQQAGMALQPQQTGYIPSFLPPGQQTSQLGVSRSFSVAALPQPLIPTNTLSAPQQQQPSFIATHRTGPANFPATAQPQPFQPQQQLSFQQPQPTGFQPTAAPQQFPQQTGFQPQSTGFPSFLPPQPTGLLPQQTGFAQQMLPHQQTGQFKPVSFGTSPKPLVPSRTGKRANLSAATPENPFGF